MDQSDDWIATRDPNTSIWIILIGTALLYAIGQTVAVPPISFNSRSAFSPEDIQDSSSSDVDSLFESLLYRFINILNL